MEQKRTTIACRPIAILYRFRLYTAGSDGFWMCEQPGPGLTYRKALVSLKQERTLWQDNLNNWYFSLKHCDDGFEVATLIHRTTAEQEDLIPMLELMTQAAQAWYWIYQTNRSSILVVEIAEI